jgi:hypothetical protein
MSSSSSRYLQQWQQQHSSSSRYLQQWQQQESAVAAGATDHYIISAGARLLCSNMLSSCHYNQLESISDDHILSPKPICQ